MDNFLHNLELSINEGFINSAVKKGRYRPELLVNNSTNNKNVLTTLQQELINSEEFLFSVAFITESGLATLKTIFYDLMRRGVTGRIITSTYLFFNQPKIFRELLKFTNVEVRLSSLTGFHTKGYIFRHKTHYSLIVGSSNLTASALKVNYEWNIKLSSHENGDIVSHFKNQFENVWGISERLTEEWITFYEEEYIKNGQLALAGKVLETPAIYDLNQNKQGLEIYPNKMQEAALRRIAHLRKDGHKKGLVISATGTGKTYLAAFDVKNFDPKRVLFIVHREQILNKAKDDFRRILGGLEEDFGSYVGARRDIDKKYVFASIQTLSKYENLHKFDPNDFDYILIDEVHKAGASSYLRVIEYFQPEFLMGMTATPDRTDDFNIYALFDYNIAYEIRLQEALEENMLCPFHYYGVTDLEIGGELINNTTILSKLVTEERVKHLIEKINFYGWSGEKVKGLIFCSKKDEAWELSGALNKQGLRTVALTGEDSQDERNKRVNQLENGLLDYILTVDIFNEGIDIPSVNQVVMLRETKSSIIFIQQLGRGLRKHVSKDFVTIIDFIGNYSTNYLIPIALSGDSSLNKDVIRRKTQDTSYIKGLSTINFEEIAKKKIFMSISNNNLSALKVLRDGYTDLKNKIGRVPLLLDYLMNNSIDPLVIIEKFDNYNHFLLKIEEETYEINEYESNVLTMISREILNGKRRHEIILLELLLQNEVVTSDLFFKRLIEEDCTTDEKAIKSVNNVLNLTFFTKLSRKKYGEKSVVEKDTNNVYKLNNEIRKSLDTNVYFTKLFTDVIYSARKISEKYKCNRPFTLYEKYSRKDACKLLNWSSDESSTIYGYKTKYGTCPIFVTYNKHDEVESSINYSDEFINEELFEWYTRSSRTLKSGEVQQIINAEQNGNEIHLFVKKDNDEGTEFYYLGIGQPDKSTAKEGKMINKNGKEIPVVHMNIVIEQAVDEKLYQYLIND